MNLSEYLLQNLAHANFKLKSTGILMKQENRAHFKFTVDSSREAYRRAVFLFDCTPQTF